VSKGQLQRMGTGFQDRNQQTTTVSISRNGRFCPETRPHKVFYRRRSSATSRIETCGERSIGAKDAVAGKKGGPHGTRIQVQDATFGRYLC
jgi:hypothetical protein